MEWQPIETAPKDGTPILVWYDHDADPYISGKRKKPTDYAISVSLGDYRKGSGIAISQWLPEEVEHSDIFEEANIYPFIRIPEAWVIFDDNFTPVCNAIYWMPLPKPPNVLDESL